MSTKQGQDTLATCSSGFGQSVQERPRLPRLAPSTILWPATTHTMRSSDKFATSHNLAGAKCKGMISRLSKLFEEPSPACVHSPTWMAMQSFGILTRTALWALCQKLSINFEEKEHQLLTRPGVPRSWLRRLGPQSIARHLLDQDSRSLSPEERI